MGEPRRLPPTFAPEHWRVSPSYRGREVDFVVQQGQRLVAIEVKSGPRRDGLPGMGAFERAYGPARKLLIGGDGTPLDAFLGATDPLR